MSIDSASTNVVGDSFQNNHLAGKLESHGHHVIANGHNGHNGHAHHNEHAHQNGHELTNGHALTKGHSLLEMPAEDTIEIRDEMLVIEPSDKLIVSTDEATIREAAEAVDPVPVEPVELPVDAAMAPLSVPKVLHRLAAARRSKGLTCEELGYRLDMTPEEVRACEHSEADLPVSILLRWAKALKVPVSRLIIEPEASILTTKLSRRHAERLMRLANRLRTHSRRRSTERLAQTFIDQLAEMMPDLAHLAEQPHGKVAKKKPLDSTVPKPLSEDVFTAPEH